MPLDIWARLDEAAAEKRTEPPRPVAPGTIQGWRAIPQACSCTWRPDYSALPATWTLTVTSPLCKVHGTRKTPAVSGTVPPGGTS